MSGNELFYHDENGVKQDRALWEELLGEKFPEIRDLGGPGSGPQVGDGSHDARSKSFSTNLLGRDPEGHDPAGELGKHLPDLWNEKGKNEAKQYLRNSIQRGTEELEGPQRDQKLSKQGNDVEITLRRVSPDEIDRVHLRGDTRYSHGEMAEYLKTSGKELPPIQLGQTEHGLHLLDGHHRWRAYLEAGKSPLVFITKTVPGVIGNPQVHLKIELGEHRAAAKRSRSETILHKAADKHLDKVQTAIIQALKSGQQSVLRSQLSQAIQSRNRHQAEIAMAIAPSVVRTALLTALPSVLLEVLADGKVAGSQLLKSKLRVTELRVAAGPDDRAKEWARDHAAELAKDISDTTRQDIADAIVDAFDDGDLENAEERIIEAVGDETRGAMIARTEIMTAVHVGQRQSWQDAVDEGILSGKERREWIAVEGACDECGFLDGTTASLDGEYDDPGGDGPPLHPNCRCSESISSGGDE